MLAEMIFDGPLKFLSGTANPDQWLIDWVNGGQPSASGEHINEENALNCPAVKAAITVLAEAIQTLPIEICETLKSGRHVQATDHPLQEILSRVANEETAAPVWKNTSQIHLGQYGNSYSLIQRNVRGDRIAGLWQRSPKPERTKPVRNPKDGKIWYELHDERGRLEELVPAVDMLHIPYFSLDGIVGKSPIRMIREAIGGNKGAERFANEMFKNGGAAEGNFTVPGRLSEPAYNRLKESIDQESDHGHRHKRRILEEGMKFDPNSHDPQKMQMIEVRRFLIEEIARAYRVTPHLLQDLTHGTFSNITELGRQFIVFTMTPWISLWTGQINWKLLKPPFHARFNAKEFLKGDPAALSAWYRTMFMIGYFSLNDIRHEEGQNPIDDANANEHFVPANMIPLSKATDQEWVKGKPAGGNQPEPKAPAGGDGVTPGDPGGDPGGRPEGTDAFDQGEALTAARAVLADTLHRMERIEANAALRAAREPKTFLSELDAFYAVQTPRVRKAVEAPLRTVLFLELGGINGAAAMIPELDRTVAEHVGGKREALLRAAECKPAELVERVGAVVEGWGRNESEVASSREPRRNARNTKDKQED